MPTVPDSAPRKPPVRRIVPRLIELDGAGRPRVGWCFAPNGHLVAGDVMLAQKIALETDERGALAVANRFPCQQALCIG